MNVGQSGQVLQWNFKTDVSEHEHSEKKKIYKVDNLHSSNFHKKEECIFGGVIMYLAQCHVIIKH